MKKLLLLIVLAIAACGGKTREPSESGPAIASSANAVEINVEEESAQEAVDDARDATLTAVFRPLSDLVEIDGQRIFEAPTGNFHYSHSLQTKRTRRAHELIDESYHLQLAFYLEELWAERAAYFGALNMKDQADSACLSELLPMHARDELGRKAGTPDFEELKGRAMMRNLQISANDDILELPMIEYQKVYEHSAPKQQTILRVRAADQIVVYLRTTFLIGDDVDPRESARASAERLKLDSFGDWDRYSPTFYDFFRAVDGSKYFLSVNVEQKRVSATKQFSSETSSSALQSFGKTLSEKDDKILRARWVEAGLSESDSSNAIVVTLKGYEVPEFLVEQLAEGTISKKRLREVLLENATNELFQFSTADLMRSLGKEGSRVCGYYSKLGSEHQQRAGDSVPF